MPNANEPKAPCARTSQGRVPRRIINSLDVCESPQTQVIPGSVNPCSGPITWTMPGMA
jgi:hypothetical protein